mgnify:CR=1 FL=1
MLKEYMIQYEFSAEQGLSATDFMHVRVGFTTKKKQGILLQLQDATNTEYISLEVNNAGKCTTEISQQRWYVYHRKRSTTLVCVPQK